MTQFRLVRSTLTIAVLLVLVPTAALAHNHLLKTDPVDGATLKSAPAHIGLWFQEKPDLTVTKLEVKGPTGAIVVGPVHLMSNNSIMSDLQGKLAPGSYVVTWQTAGDDGHVSKGQFTFTLAP